MTRSKDAMAQPDNRCDWNPGELDAHWRLLNPGWAQRVVNTGRRCLATRPRLSPPQTRRAEPEEWSSKAQDTFRGTTPARPQHFQKNTTRTVARRRLAMWLLPSYAAENDRRVAPSNSPRLCIRAASCRPLLFGTTLGHSLDSHQDRVGGRSSSCLGYV